MIGATLDANVFISAFITPAGTPRRVWQAWRDGRFALISSEHIVGVTLQKPASPRLAERYRVAAAERDLFASLVRARATMIDVGPLDVISVTGDPEDDAVLATVRLGTAMYLVTGDGGLLDLATYGGTDIVTPRRFLDLLDTMEI